MTTTAPPPGLFTADAAMIARTLASKRVSPKGVTSELRMFMFFINRAGRGLSRSHRVQLEQAKRLMQVMVRERRKGGTAARSGPAAPGRAGMRV